MLIDGRWFIPDHEFEWRFVQSSGPGGQNVNKVATAVRLSFDVAGSSCLPPEIRERLLARLAGRLTADGRLTVAAGNCRTQLLNWREALAKLEALLTECLQVRKIRRPTRPTGGSIRRRLAAKRYRSEIKAERRRRADDAGE